MSQSSLGKIESNPAPRRPAASLMIFVFAFFVRALHANWIVSAPFFSYKIGDANKYDLWAREIVNGNWLGTEVFYQAPLYPYFLATVYAWFGDGIMTVRIVQAFLGAIACVFMMNAITNLFNRRAGIVAGILIALYAPSIFLESLIQKSVFDLFFFSALLWLVSKTLQSDQKKWWAWIGLTTGLLCLTRENALVVIPVIGLWALFRQPWSVETFQPLKGRIAFCLAFGLGLMVALAPVAFRNYYVGGEFHVTTSQMGPNFYIGNNPTADGTYSPLRVGRGDAIHERNDAVEIAENAMGRTLTPGEVSDYFMAQSWAFISADPIGWLKLLGKKTLLTFNGTELVDTEDQYTHAKWSPLLMVLSTIFHFGLLVPFGFIGLWLTRRNWRELWWAYLMLAAFTASVIGFFVFGRYRFPMVPLLMMFAAPGLVHLYDIWKGQGARKLISFVPAFACLIVFCNLPLVDRELAQSITLSNFGVQALIRDDVELAEGFFNDAIELQPENAVAHCNLGVLYWRHGQSEKARQHFHHALEANPHFESARERLEKMNQELAIADPGK